MSNYLVGHGAEVRAANYLKTQGFSILELNWKTRYCEIDIVAKKDQRIYFVEVKYRRNSKHGYGLDYITGKKLRQMSFASEMWIHEHSAGLEYQLAIISIDNDQITLVDEL